MYYMHKYICDLDMANSSFATWKFEGMLGPSPEASPTT